MKPRWLSVLPASGILWAGLAGGGHVLRGDEPAAAAAEAPACAARLTAGQAAPDATGWTVGSRTATFLLGAADAADCRIEAVLVMKGSGAAVALNVQAEDTAAAGGPGAVHLTINRDREGRVLAIRQHAWNADQGQWRWQRGDPNFDHRFWPTDRQTGELQLLKLDGFTEPRTWIGRPMTLRVDLAADRLQVWLEGLYVGDQPAPATGPVVLQLSAGDRLEGVRVKPLPTTEVRFEPVDLSALANRTGGRLEAAEGAVAVDGIPFLTASAGNDHLDLRSAGWIDQLRDPGSFYSSYDGGPPFLFDERMPMLRVPKADYVAMHLLAVADDTPDTVPRFTLRAGRYGHRGQVFQHEFVADVPVAGSPGAAVTAADGVGFYHVRLPLHLAFAQDVEARFIDMELTRDVRLAVRRPDPSRFRFRPAGLPSGVRIAAITLERSPLQMTVTSDRTGHAFNEPDTPEFQIRLRNVTDREQPFAIEGMAFPLRGETVTATHVGTVAAGAEETVALPVPIARGYADVAVTLRGAAGDRLMTRRTAMALLPPLASRRYRDRSPFGTWDFSGTHFTATDPDTVGPLYEQLGMRFGMSGFPVESLERFDVWIGSEANVHGASDGMRDRLEKRGDRGLPYAQVFHETSISGPHSSRVPDLFHDRPPYDLNEAEQERFDAMWTMAADNVAVAREACPQFHLRFGNGPIAVREEFYRRGLPADTFDSAGNESGVFGRMPEAQPPDVAALNATIWMDRQLLDHYGYADKPVTLGYEVIYPNTNPGNVDYETQADYMVRHALHALAWRMEHIRPGAISDMGNSYRFSNWGSSGFTRHRPDFSIKPAFVSFAAMSWALDGAVFDRVLDTGSFSVYGLAFDRPDGAGKIYALWTVRGRRPVTLVFDRDPAAVEHIDCQTRVTALAAADGAVTVEVSSSPVFVGVRGAEVGKIRLGEPDHRDALPPADQLVAVADLGAIGGWRTVAEDNPQLDHYNNKTAPRRKGDFTFEAVDAFDGRVNVLQVTPRPIGHGKPTMPMYAERVHDEGFLIPGAPTELGVWVNGNSAWGRIIFSLTDASGQVWTQIGAADRGEVSPWLQDWMPDELIDAIRLAGFEDWNTNDIFGDSRINFDGWRLVRVPLPGHYPGEEGRRYHWYRSSQWHSSGDGQVRYPLRLTRVIVELNERVLHVDRFEPPARPDIHLGPVVAIHGEPPGPRDANRDPEANPRDEWNR